MQFFDARESFSGSFSGDVARSWGGAMRAKQPWLLAFALIAALHAVLIAAYLRQKSVEEIPAKPLVMDVALIAQTLPKPVAPTPPAPPAAPPKPKVKPVVKPAAKPKKTPAPVKKPLPAVKTQPVARPEPESIPAAKTAAAPAPPQPASKPAPPAPSSAPAKPKAETFTEANYSAAYKSNPKPAYPRLAKNRGWQGRVLLRVTITADGRAGDISVQQSSGHEMLDEAAVEAVKKWTFTPARRGDTAVASTRPVPIVFKLDD